MDLRGGIEAMLILAFLGCRVSPRDGNRWEKNTWPELERLARDVPEAGIHFQGMFGVG